MAGTTERIEGEPVARTGFRVDIKHPLSSLSSYLCILRSISLLSSHSQSLGSDQVARYPLLFLLCRSFNPITVLPDTAESLKAVRFSTTTMLQSSPCRLQRLALILSLVLLFTRAHGFFPTPWKEKTFGNSGVSHIEQTEQAFQTLATRYFPTLEGLTKSMLRARDTIAAANADVDKDQDGAFKHCDDESFDAAQARLSDLQGQVIDHLINNKPDDARKVLGSALHTVQDFYSHSNWVEMGSEKISDTLGRGGRLVYAGPLDWTCVDCHPHSLIDTSDAYCLNCRDNESGMTSLLTSGYYLGERESDPGIPEFKCHHGISTPFFVTFSTPYCYPTLSHNIWPANTKFANCLYRWIYGQCAWGCRWFDNPQIPC